MHTQKQSKTRDWRVSAPRGGSIQQNREPQNVSLHNAAINTNSVPKSANAPVSGRISSQVSQKRPPNLARVPKINMPAVPRAPGAIHATMHQSEHGNGKISSSALAPAVPPPPKIAAPSVKVPNVPPAKIPSASYPISPAQLAWRENPQALAMIRGRMLQLAQDHDAEHDPDRRAILLSLIDRYARIQNDALHNPLTVAEAQRIIQNQGQDNWIDRKLSPVIDRLIQGVEGISGSTNFASAVRNLGYVFGLPAIIANDYLAGEKKGNKSLGDALAERAWYAYAPDWIKQAIYMAPLSSIRSQSESSFDVDKIGSTMADAFERIVNDTMAELGGGINQLGSEQRNVLRSRYLANNNLTSGQMAALVPFISLKRFADPLFNEYLPKRVGPVGIDTLYLRKWYDQHVLGSFPPEVINAAEQIGLIGNQARIEPISVPSQGAVPSQEEQGGEAQQQQQQPQQQQQQQPPHVEKNEINTGTNTIPIPEKDQTEQLDTTITDAQMQKLKTEAEAAQKAENDAREAKRSLISDRTQITRDIDGIKVRLRTWGKLKIPVNVDNPDWSALLKLSEKSDIISAAQDEIEGYRTNWPQLQEQLNNVNKKIDENRDTIKKTRKLAYDATMRYRHAQLTGDASNAPKQEYQTLIDSYYNAYTDDTPSTISAERGKILEEQKNIEKKISENKIRIEELDTEYNSRKKEYDEGYEKHMSKYSPEKLPDIKKGVVIFGGDNPQVLKLIHDLVYTPQRTLRDEIKDNRVITRGVMGFEYDRVRGVITTAKYQNTCLYNVLQNTGASKTHSAEYNRAMVIAKNHTVGGNNQTLDFDTLLEKLPSVKGKPRGSDITRIAKNYVEYINLADAYLTKNPEPKISPDKEKLENQNIDLTNQYNELQNQITAKDNEYSVALTKREKNISKATQNIIAYEKEYRNSAQLPKLPFLLPLLQTGIKIGGNEQNEQTDNGNIQNAIKLGTLFGGNTLLGLLARHASRDVPPSGYINLRYQAAQNPPLAPLPAPNAPANDFARSMERWIARQYADRDQARDQANNPSLMQRISNAVRGFVGRPQGGAADTESINKIDGGIVRLDTSNSQSILQSNYTAIGGNDDKATEADLRANLIKESMDQPHISKLDRNTKLLDAPKNTNQDLGWIDDALNAVKRTGTNLGDSINSGYNSARNSLNSITDKIGTAVKHKFDLWRGHNDDPNAEGMELANIDDYHRESRESLLNANSNYNEEEEIDTKKKKKKSN